MLVRAGFLDRSDGAGVALFHHPLVQDAAYGRLLRRQRVQLHLRVAEAAEQLYGAGDDSLALLARHLYLGGAPEALDYLMRAAGVAKRLFANDEAIVHLRRAAEVGERERRDDVLPGILFELGDLVELRGDFEEAFDLYRRSRDATGEMRAWLGMASTLRKRGRYSEALDTLEAAEATLPASDPDHGKLGLERARTLVMARRFGDAAEMLSGALGAAEPGSVHAGYLMLLLSRAELALGRPESSVSLGREAHRILEAQGDERGMVAALRNLGGVYGTLGRMEQAATALRQGVVLGERIGNTEELAACLLNLGMVELRLGQIDEAIRCDLRAIEELERMGHESGVINGYANLASALVRAGRLDEALAYAGRTLEAAHRVGDQLAVADSYLTQATVYLAQGQAAAAGSRAEEAAELFGRLGATPPRLEALHLAAEAWKAAGEPAKVEEIRRRTADQGNHQ